MVNGYGRWWWMVNGRWWWMGMEAGMWQKKKARRGIMICHFFRRGTPCSGSCTLEPVDLARPLQKCSVVFEKRWRVSNRNSVLTIHPTNCKNLLKDHHQFPELEVPGASSKAWSSWANDVGLEIRLLLSSRYHSISSITFHARAVTFHVLIANFRHWGFGHKDKSMVHPASDRTTGGWGMTLICVYLDQTPFGDALATRCSPASPMSGAGLQGRSPSEPMTIVHCSHSLGFSWTAPCWTISLPGLHSKLRAPRILFQRGFRI